MWLLTKQVHTQTQKTDYKGRATHAPPTVSVTYKPIYIFDNNSSLYTPDASIVSDVCIIIIVILSPANGGVDEKKSLRRTERDSHSTGFAAGSQGRESYGCKGENREGACKDWMYHIM